MKTIFKNICLVLVFVFAGSLTGIAQISPEGVEGAKDLEKKKEEVKEIVREDIKNDQEGIKAVKDQKKQDLKKEKRELKEKTKGDKRELKEGMKDAKSELKKETKDAKRELKDKMKEKKRGHTEDVEGVNKEAAANQQTISVTDGIDGLEGSQTEAKSLKKLKGKKLGQQRASNAKKMIESKENQMVEKDAFVVKSKTKIATAKKSLAAQIAAGSISKDQIDAKQTSIGKAEKSLKAYEERVAAAKQKYSNQKTKVAELYKAN